MLWRFANGLDSSGVATYYAMPPIKSIGNSTTAPRDLLTDDDIKITLYALCESVAARLREQHSLCSTVQLGTRDTALFRYERQEKLSVPVSNSTDIFNAVFRLFCENRPVKLVRSLSVRALGLSLADEAPPSSLCSRRTRAGRNGTIWSGPRIGSEISMGMRVFTGEYNSSILYWIWTPRA